MSQIMEKALASIPKLLAQTITGGKSAKPPMKPILNTDFERFLKTVHSAQSKSHEAAIINSKLMLLQQELKRADLSPSPVILKNAFTIAMFCDLLGYDVSFMAIYAVNLAQQGKGYEKRLGYLLCCLLLHPHHEMVILLMATLLRDLKSSNMGDNCLALLVASQLVNDENIPTILPEVFRKLNHSSDLVKEKALYCIKAFHQRAPNSLQSSISLISNFLESRDPGVLSAVVNIFMTFISENPFKFTYLAKGFLHILQQINESKFGSSYYYHMIPLPWLQINLLKILGMLGAVEPNLQEPISAKIQMLIEMTKVNEPISLAILVESIHVASKINANEHLLQLCSRCIGKLLSPNASNSMRYQGLGLLISLSKVKASFAAQHQMAVVDCLSDDDPTIQSRTTYLLHAMANKSNIKAINTKLFEQIKKTKDSSVNTDILLMISDLTERFSSSIDSYIATYFDILEVELSTNDEHHFIEQVLSKLENIFCNDQHLQEDELRKVIDLIFYPLHNKNPIHPTFVLSIQMIGILAPEIGSHFSTDTFLDCVEKLLMTQDTTDLVVQESPVPDISVKQNSNITSSQLSQVKCYCLTSTMKLILSNCIDLKTFKTWFYKNDYKKIIRDINVVLCLDELEELIQQPESLKLRSVIMFQSNTAQIDLSLSFLDPLVLQDLLQGHDSYIPSYVRFVPEPPILYTVPKQSQHVLSTSVDKEKLDQSKTSSIPPLKVTQAGLPSKWNDDNEGMYLADNEANDHLEKDKKKKEEIAKELFSGLAEMDSLNTVAQLESLKDVKLKSKQFWEDDETNEGFSLSLNPFGLTRKTKSMQKQRWFEEEIDNDSEAAFSLDNFISSQSEKFESPNDGVADTSLPAVSTMFSEHSNKYFIQNSVSVSTVDTLTDSDPDNSDS